MQLEQSQSLEELQSLIEALLFASEKPLSVKDLESLILDVSPQELRNALEALRILYEPAHHGISLELVAGGYQFRTKLDKASWVTKLQAMKPARMSRAQLETLAIIAYKQPVTRIEIDLIRGVDSSHLLKTLLEKKLIRITGVKEAPGRPLIYGTTSEFLEFFSLSDLSVLPSLEQLKELRGNEKTDTPLFAQDTLDEAQLASLQNDQSSNFNKSSGS